MPVDKIPEKNSILFVWLNNYSGVLLKTPSKTLLIDPVEIKVKNFPQVDAVLITHEHYDHLDQRLIGELHKNTGCSVIGDSKSIMSLKTNMPPENLQEISPGETVNVGEVIVRAEKCNHNAAAPVTYVIKSEDGVKIFHTADSLPYPEMAFMAQKEPIDVVFCTVGIAQGSTPKTGSEIAWLIKPKVAVPYHTNSVDSQKQFVEIIRNELPKTACLIPEVNKIYQISLGEKKDE